jgi:hypothetical protein
VAAHDPRGTLRCSECLAEPSRAVVPLGLLLRNGSHEAQANHNHDSEPSGRRATEVAWVEAIVTTRCRAYGMCGPFHFCTAVPVGLLLHSGSCGARGNHDHDSEPLGHRAAEVAGPEAVVTMIPEPTGRRAYGMCGTFRFCATVPPLLSPALTDALDMGPLVSAWL